MAAWSSSTPLVNALRSFTPDASRRPDVLISHSLRSTLRTVNNTGSRGLASDAFGSSRVNVCGHHNHSGIALRLTTSVSENCEHAHGSTADATDRSIQVTAVAPRSDLFP